MRGPISARSHPLRFFLPTSNNQDAASCQAVRVCVAGVSAADRAGDYIDDCRRGDRRRRWR
jgi:hypothetical protein